MYSVLSLASMPTLWILKLHFITIPNLLTTGCGTLEQLSFHTMQNGGNVWYHVNDININFYFGKQRGEGVSDWILYLYFLCALNNYSSWYSPFPTMLFIFGYPSLVFDMVGCPGNEDLHVFVVRTQNQCYTKLPGRWCSYSIYGVYWGKCEQAPH